MLTKDAIAQILRIEGIEYLSCFPSTTMIEAATQAGIRPIVCRQERVGVGIADGYARVTNGRPPGAFAMQFGPGAENSFSGISTAFSDGTPVLLLPLGHARVNDGVFPMFSSVRTYRSVTKSVEQVSVPEKAPDTLRRAFAQLRMGRPGPVLVEIPVDVAEADIDSALVENYRPATRAASQGDPANVDASVKALLAAKRPVILAGGGILYAEASDELRELAEYLQLPVATTMEGKSSFPESHPLALGSLSAVMSRPALEFVRDADLVLAIGTSLTRHMMVAPIPPGKTIIQCTNNPVDIGKAYAIDHAVLGDAKLVLRQLMLAARDLTKGTPMAADDGPAGAIASTREAWLAEWMPKLTSGETPINPYRVVWEFMQNVDPAEAIVTHDAGGPRFELMPFYRSNGPRTYIGWGKSHALGAGLGFTIGAKLAAPEKLCANFMGDASFGMTGLDFETAVRAGLPILTIMLNNGGMTGTAVSMELSEEKYGVSELGGNYADMARAMGGWAERVEDPDDVGPAILRAKRATEEGRAALLEFICSQETAKSHLRGLG